MEVIEVVHFSHPSHCGCVCVCVLSELKNGWQTRATRLLQAKVNRRFVLIKLIIEWQWNVHQNQVRSWGRGKQGPTVLPLPFFYLTQQQPKMVFSVDVFVQIWMSKKYCYVFCCTFHHTLFVSISLSLSFSHTQPFFVSREFFSYSRS